jgi:hypothetical protein
MIVICRVPPPSEGTVNVSSLRWHALGDCGVLSDADKRARYDRGEIDASGVDQPRQSYEPRQIDRLEVFAFQVRLRGIWLFAGD